MANLTSTAMTLYGNGWSSQSGSITQTPETILAGLAKALVTPLLLTLAQQLFDWVQVRNSVTPLATDVANIAEKSVQLYCKSTPMADKVAYKLTCAKVLKALREQNFPSKLLNDWAQIEGTMISCRQNDLCESLLAKYFEGVIAAKLVWLAYKSPSMTETEVIGLSDRVKKSCENPLLSKASQEICLKVQPVLSEGIIPFLLAVDKEMGQVNPSCFCLTPDEVCLTPSKPFDPFQDERREANCYDPYDAILALLELPPHPVGIHLRKVLLDAPTPAPTLDPETQIAREWWKNQRP